MVDNLDNEIWMPFPEWEMVCEISNKGRVKSLPRKAITKTGKHIIVGERLKKLTPNHRNKYLMITLNDSNRHETICVHRIVAEVFIPNPLNLPEVNHKKTKNDITVDDLEWISISDNKKDAHRRGLIKMPKGANSVFARKVGRYLDGELIEVYEYVGQAVEQGFERNSIKQACDTNWLHKGYNWKYLEPPKTKRKKFNKPPRPIGCFKDGKLEIGFTSIIEAFQKGYERRAVYRALKGEAHTHKGYTWKYLD